LGSTIKREKLMGYILACKAVSQGALPEIPSAYGKLFLETERCRSNGEYSKLLLLLLDDNKFYSNATEGLSWAYRCYLECDPDIKDIKIRRKIKILNIIKQVIQGGIIYR
jgi:hypothetical protein